MAVIGIIIAISFISFFICSLCFVFAEGKAVDIFYHLTKISIAMIGISILVAMIWLGCTG